MLLPRAAELRERMDDPACNEDKLYRTYRQFEIVNRLVSGWPRLFKARLAPLLRGGGTVLDVGCGGGDLARKLRSWGEQLGLELQITAIDPDPRALAFALSCPPVSGVTFHQASVQELQEAGERFDVVISNHVLHHLPVARLAEFFDSTARLAGRAVFHNDLRRHEIALAAFALCWPLFPRSFIVGDGIRSIRRAFTPAELEPLLPAGWHLESLAPFRNLVVFER